MAIPQIDQSQAVLPHKILTTEMIGSNSSCWDELDCSNLEQMFAALHYKLIDCEDGNESEDDDDDIFDLPLLEIASKDTSLLNKCISALAMGKPFSSFGESSQWNIARTSIFTATEILRNMKRKKPGKLKEIVGSSLHSHNCSKGLWRILSNIGVAPSKEYFRRQDKDATIAKLLAGLNIRPHDMITFGYDNYGAKIVGAGASYLQYVIQQIIVTRREKLQEKRVYPNDDGGGHVLSRERRDWNNIRDTTSFKDVMGVTDADVDRLANTALKLIDLMLELERKEELPFYNESKDFLSGTEGFKWDRKIPDLSTLSNLKDDDVGEMESENGASPTSREDVGTEKFQSNYEASNVELDRPMELDLSKKSTVKTLMEYAVEAKNICTSKNETEGIWSSTPKIMDDYGVALLGDGAPTYLMSTLIRELGKESEVKAYFGGFHLCLEGHKKRGAIFGPSHLHDIWSSWRTTKGQLQWVMAPGDPNQVDSEMVMYYLAAHLVAIRSFLTGERSKVDEDADSFEVTALDIVDFMLKRAEEWPIVMVILIELRYAELIMMLHEAERTGNGDLYITALKFIAPLMASSHATKYTSMIMDFFVNWYTSSEADKVIYVEVMLTKKTKNGKLIFTDRFVEWMMRDLRSWLGNIGSSHTTALLERHLLRMTKRKAAKKFSHEETKSKNCNDNKLDEDCEKEAMVLDYVFCETLIWFEDANIFGPGPPKHIPTNTSKKRKRDGWTDYSPNEFTTVGDASINLNSELLKTHSIGQQRLQKYFDVYFKKGDMADWHRSENEEDGGVSLKAIDPINTAEEKTMLLDLERSTTCDYKIVFKLYTNSELKTEQLYLNSLLPEEERKPIEKKKNELVLNVIYSRQKIHNLNPQWKEIRKKKIQDKLDANLRAAGISRRKTIKDELSGPIFTLASRGRARELTDNTRKHTFQKNRDRVAKAVEGHNLMEEDCTDNALILDDNDDVNVTADMNIDGNIIERRPIRRQKRSSFQFGKLRNLNII